MKRKVLIGVALLLVIPLIALALQNARSNAPVDAETMGKQVEAITPPQFDEAKGSQPGYIQSFVKQRDEFFAKRAEISKQFYDRFPNHPKAITFMMQRWSLLAQQNKTADVLSETAKVLGTKLSDDQRADVLYVQAVMQIRTMPDTPSEKVANTIDAFVKAAPKDERGGELLVHLAQGETDTQKQNVTYKKVVELYPETQSALVAKGILRQTEQIGKPFELNFTDAIGGKAISLQKDLKGKIVVIDFWATWCGPCVAAMPEMKATYDKYQTKGVEFVGVSLDEPESDGGLTKLKNFVKENQVPWPQYYQGKGWDSEFSKSWGIYAIPCVFIVDADGKLYSNVAHGQLEKMIPELIKTRDAKP